MIVAVILLLELLVAATVVVRRVRKRFHSPCASIAAFDATMAALEPATAHTPGARADVFALDGYRVRRRARSVSRDSIGNRAVTPKSSHSCGGSA